MARFLSENTVLMSEHTATRDQVQALLNKAETLWRAGDPGQLPEAWRACEAAAALLPPETPQASADASPPPADAAGDPVAAAQVDAFTALRASTSLMRGRLLVARGAPEAAVEALRCFDQAIVCFKSLPGGGIDLAAAWMNRGGALLQLGAAGALEDGAQAFREAVRSYEQAIAQFGDAPPREFLDALGAAWLNRGVGLSAFSGDEPRAEAGHSFERAIAILEPLAAAQPVVRRNLAAAWSARADLRAVLGDAPGAVDSANRAVGIFRALLENDAAPVVRAEFAELLLRHGHACAVAADAAAARAAAREALTLLAPLEGTDLACARQALRARHALCAALAVTLVNEHGDARDAQVAEAGDLAEEGLDFVQSRDPAAGAALAGEGARLFEFGAWLYRTQQPRFLAEFLLERVNADLVRARIAGKAVQLARQDIVQRGFSGANASDLQRAADLLAGLAEVDEHLRSLAAAAPDGKVDAA